MRRGRACIRWPPFTFFTSLRCSSFSVCFNVGHFRTIIFVRTCVLLRLGGVFISKPWVSTCWWLWDTIRVTSFGDIIYTLNNRSVGQYALTVSTSINKGARYIVIGKLSLRTLRSRAPQHVLNRSAAVAESNKHPFSLDIPVFNFSALFSLVCRTHRLFVWSTPPPARVRISFPVPISVQGSWTIA